VAGDRKHALERGVQARVVAAILSDIGLQELAIGIQLDREQVRHLEDALPLAEVFTDALFLGERIRHLGSPIQFGPLGNSSRRRKLGAARHRAPALRDTKSTQTRKATAAQRPQSPPISTSLRK